MWRLAGERVVGQFCTDGTWKQDARGLQTSLCLVERGVAAETS